MTWNPIAAAAAKAARHRVFTWCRRQNGFCDDPLWRVVAQRAGLPPFQVIAFVNRLEERANAGEPRGTVEHFSAEEFGVALGMPTEQAERIFAVLQEPGVEWVVEGHVDSFIRRNPDKLDETAAQRGQRTRDRRKIRELLVELARRGVVSADDRVRIEIGLRDMGSEELAALLKQLRRASWQQLSSASAAHLAGAAVENRAAVVDKPAAAAARGGLSTALPSRVTNRDAVTITPRADQRLSTGAVDNSAEAASEAEKELAKQGSEPQPADPADTRDADAVDKQQREEAAAWLASEGARLVTELAHEQPGRVATLMERWGRDLDDPVLMVEIIASTVESGAIGARLQLLIGEQVKRHLDHKRAGLPLPLMPPRPSKAAANVPRETSAGIAADGGKRKVSNA